MKIDKDYIDIAIQAPIELDDKIELLSLIQEELFELFNDSEIEEDEYKEINKYAYDKAKKLFKI